MSAKRKWQKFNFVEWRSDKNLARVSREARSFWLDLCGLIYEARDRGRLSIDGRPYTVDDLSEILGDDKRVVKRLLLELKNAGVYDRDHDGFIVSRRILREEVSEDFYQKSGRKGGNPALKNKALAETPLNLKNQIPDTRVEPIGSISEDKSSAQDAFDFSKPGSAEAGRSEPETVAPVSAWTAITAAICDQTGEPEKTVRRFVGLLAKRAGGKSGEALLEAVIFEALAQAPADLKSWLHKALDHRLGKVGGGGSGYRPAARDFDPGAPQTRRIEVDPETGQRRLIDIATGTVLRHLGAPETSGVAA